MKKASIISLVMLLVIGFAVLSTNLIIKGQTKIGFNEEDYDIYFSDAYIDGVRDKSVIQEDKKSIVFETKTLMNPNDSTTLEYVVTNASKQYDGYVYIKCVPQETNLFKVENVIDKELIKAREIATGNLTVTMKKVAEETQDVEITCSIEVSASPRTEANTGKIESKCTYPDGQTWVFNANSSVQNFSAPCDGEYKLEVWGAQGGSSGGTGGYGAYATGSIDLEKEQLLYVVVGAQGSAYGDRGSDESKWAYGYGGYNGGGNGYSSCGNGGGGGATHISFSSGVLSSLANNKDSIIIVASGGGGAYHWKRGNGNGNHGGGYAVTSASNTYANGTFGQGAYGQGANCGGGAGGGGYQGGPSGGNTGYGGGGSSYIGNNLLYKKAMYCYSCAISNDENNKTIASAKVSASPISEYAKQGSGYAKITLVLST